MTIWITYHSKEDMYAYYSTFVLRFFLATFLVALTCVASIPFGAFLLFPPMFWLGTAMNGSLVFMFIIGVGLLIVGNVSLPGTLTSLPRAVRSGIGSLGAALVAFLVTFVGDPNYAIAVSATASIQIAVLYWLANQLLTRDAFVRFLVGIGIGSILVIGTRSLAPTIDITDFPAYFVWYVWTAIIWVSGSVGWYVGSTRRVDWILVAWGVACGLSLFGVWAL